MEEVFGEAGALEKKYDWLKAIDVYEQALRAVGKRDFSRAGEIQERVGYCLYRGAFQAETQDKFKGRMLEAAEAYEKAAEVCEKVEHARSLYCRAMALYANSCVLVNASRKKQVLDDCGELLKKAIKAFEDVGDRLGYGKACNDLLVCLWDRFWLEWDWRENRRRLEEAIKHSQTAISTLSKVGDERELARAYIIAALHSWQAGLGLLGEEKMEEFTQTTLGYVEKALELSRKTGDEHLIAWSNALAAMTQMELTSNLELSLRHAEESLQQAKKTRDSDLIGWARAAQALVTSWIMCTAEEDPDKKREGLERVTRYAEDAVRHLLKVCRYDYLPTAYMPYSESHYFLACEVETDPKERRNLLERAIEVAQEGLEYAEQSGIPEIATVHHSLSKALYSLSRMETQITEKRRLLKEASDHRQKSINIKEQTEPFFYWNHGVMQSYAALIKAELATIETDKEKKRGLLEEAVSHMERCLELCTKWTLTYPQPKFFATVGWFYDWFGDVLNQLYSLTREEETLEKAIEVHESAAETYRKAELPTRVAEAHWHAARLYDQLGEHTEAERNFQSASENYKLAAEKIPQLKEFYMDHALYMQAWSEIEKARHHHAKRQYGQAKEHYEKATELHESTEGWSYLNPNYLAWAKLEEAENLSREEKGEEATGAFKEAADLFCKAKISIKTRLKKIRDIDEKKMATELIKASDLRHEYCQGRIALEEAKILDKQGDHMASSEKYGSAAETFQKIAKAESEQARKELQPIIYLCQAWEKMMMAEAKASSTMYGEAAALFKQAKEHTLDQPTSLLALANSSFCKALEAGTEFEITRDTRLHSAATQHLEGAASYYLKAGFKTASEYAKATQRLFDAYVYIDTAKRETDPRRKAQYYQMAEKLLQASAGSYMKAKHPEKSGEVRRLLESVEEERQLAMSLTEVLHVPTIASATTSFSAPAPTHEQAVGLERFEHADIQANLILKAKDVKVGEDMNLEIELINAGKAPALLIKVEEIIPESFEIKEVPEIYRVEDRYLNMKGKRLNPLKTEEVKIIVKPLSKGVFIMKPRILYLDETGKYKSHEPEPVPITVKELGIKGWIKGER